MMTTLDASFALQRADTAFQDLRSLTALITRVNGIDEHSDRAVLHLRQAAYSRLAMAHRYPGPARLSTEAASISAGAPGLVLALEEERTEQRGLLIRIIDSIIHAFQWLWKKIVSIFKDTQEDKSEEKAKQTQERLQPLSEKEVAIKDLMINDRELVKIYGYLEEITPNKLLEAMYQIEKTTELLRQIAEGVQMSFKTLVEVFSSDFKVLTLDELQRLEEKLVTELAACFNMMPVASASTLHLYLSASGETHTPTDKARLYAPMPYGAGLLATERRYGDKTMPTLLYVKKPFDKERARLVLPTPSEASLLLNAFLKAREKITLSAGTLIKFYERAEERTKRLDTLLKDHWASLPPEAHALQDALKHLLMNTGSTVNAIASVAMTAFDQNRDACIAVLNFVEKYTAALHRAQSLND